MVAESCRECLCAVFVRRFSDASRAQPVHVTKKNTDITDAYSDNRDDTDIPQQFIKDITPSSAASRVACTAVWFAYITVR
jgi:phosphorylcholine metabolism protein LicD